MTDENGRICSLCNWLLYRDLVPCLKSLLQDGTILQSEMISSRSKVIRDGAKGGEKTLRMPRRFEMAHRAFALSRRLMGVFSTIV